MFDPSNDYAKRIKEFDSRLQDAKSDALKSLLKKAVSATSDTAVVVSELADLSNDFATFAKHEYSALHSDIKNTVQNVAELNTNLDALIQDSTIDASIKKSLVIVKYQAAVSSKQTAEAGLTTTDLLVQSFSTVSMLLINTLGEKVLRPDHKTFYAKAAREAILFAIGFIPIVGKVKAGVALISSMVKAFKGPGPVADEYLGYLEQYTATVELWCEATRKVISIYRDHLIVMESPS